MGFTIQNEQDGADVCYGDPTLAAFWYGGPPAGFPNGYWDNDGFGLYSVERGGGLPNDAPIWVDNGPNPQIDVHTERPELTSVVRQAYQGAVPARA
jgi:hypothetical protein